jgi:hypothetical protein
MALPCWLSQIPQNLFNPKFIWPICPIGPKVWDIVEKRLHGASVFFPPYETERFFSLFWIKLMKYSFNKETMWPEISQSKIKNSKFQIPNSKNQKFSFFLRCPPTYILQAPCQCN